MMCGVQDDLAAARADLSVHCGSATCGYTPSTIWDGVFERELKGCCKGLPYSCDGGEWHHARLARDGQLFGGVQVRNVTLRASV